MTDEDAVRAATLDYVEGWFDGNSTRMERALHPELVKRRRDREDSDPDALKTMSATEMIDATVAGGGRDDDAEDRRIKVEVSYLSGDIASVTCLCHSYVDLLHLLRTPGGWKIVNVAWDFR